MCSVVDLSLVSFVVAELVDVLRCAQTLLGASAQRDSRDAVERRHSHTAEVVQEKEAVAEVEREELAISERVGSKKTMTPKKD